WRFMLIRHCDRDHGPQIPDVHAELSQSDPALGETGFGNCRCARAVRVRYGLWALFRPRHTDRRGGEFCGFGQAVCRGDQWQVRSCVNRGETAYAHQANVDATFSCARSGNASAIAARVASITPRSVISAVISRAGVTSKP